MRKGVSKRDNNKFKGGHENCVASREEKKKKKRIKKQKNNYRNV